MFWMTGKNVRSLRLLFSPAIVQNQDHNYGRLSYYPSVTIAAIFLFHVLRFWALSGNRQFFQTTFMHSLQLSILANHTFLYSYSIFSSSVAALVLRYRAPYSVIISVPNCKKYSAITFSALLAPSLTQSYCSPVVNSCKHGGTLISDRVSSLSSTRFNWPQYCDLTANRSSWTLWNSVLGTPNCQLNNLSGHT